MASANPPASILAASVHDVRFFAALLRGVNFVNRATVTITETGFVVTVEEARTLLATAYVFSHIFDEYQYHPEPNKSQRLSQITEEETIDNTAFEIPLNTLIECLNIFGTAGSSTAANSDAQSKKWRRADGNDADDDRAARQNGGGIEQYFSRPEKRTGMRMSYAGAGHPLILLVAEDAAGPTTTCEIITFDPEPHLELPFDAEQTVLKIILKSSWLRDALSELDPSCEKLTIIGNPPPPAGTNARFANSQPILRIQAGGSFGSTEMDYPNDREVLETFECGRTMSFSYRFTHISRTMRALQSSLKTSLRIDEEGLLSLQFMMPSSKANAGASPAFIEFRCLSLDDDV